MSSPDQPESGAVPFTIGISSLVRIPIPNTNGLCIELSPRGYVPPGGTTSTIFFQDISGKRHLRLDYGYNIQTKTIDYHWNQKGTHADFGIKDHAPAGSKGAALYKAAKYFRYAGRTLVVFGAAVDIASIVVASSPMRRASEVVSGWALAWAGCKVVGAGGAAAGMLASPAGAAIAGIGGCIIGGYAGYRLGTQAGGVVYDWAQTTFYPLPQVQQP